MKLFTVLFVLAAALAVVIAVAAAAAAVVDVPNIPGLNFNEIEQENQLYDELLASMDDSFNSEILGAPAQSQITLAAKLSAAAYCVGWNIQALANWQSKSCPKEATMASTTAWQFDGVAIGAYVGYDTTARLIRVVFRGSANIENWIANLAFAKTTWGGSGSVHTGFKAAYSQARPKIVAKIIELRTKYPLNVGVQVTGHSLGGAVATLAAVDFKAGVFTVTSFSGLTHVSSDIFPEPMPFTVDELQMLGAEQLTQTFPLGGPTITFGSPRVGDSSAASYINSKLSGNFFRITHRHDPVPRVPTQSMGFAHPPQEGYYPNADSNISGFFWCNSSMVEDSRCIISPLINVSITDHLWYSGIYLKQDANTCSP